MSDEGKAGLDFAELRRRAVERMMNQTADPRGPPSESELQRLVHELEVHQIELEIQNEDLREARSELEMALARYTDLYDFAPTGYFTLAGDGEILAVNLTGAKLVGIERDRLIKLRLTSLVSSDDRRQLAAILEAAVTGDGDGACEATLEGNGTTPLIVRIEVRPSKGGNECRAAIFDITERRQIETQRNQLVKDLQEAAAKIKVLRGMLPICTFCKKIRDDNGYWEQLESYISVHSEAEFSHGICPVCLKAHYPEYDLSDPA